MKAWPVPDAKARFEEFLDACLTEGSQLVTRSGVEVAVLVSAAQWGQMTATTNPSLKELLLSNKARTDFLVPTRGTASQQRGNSIQ